MSLGEAKGANVSSRASSIIDEYNDTCDHGADNFFSGWIDSAIRTILSNDGYWVKEILTNWMSSWESIDDTNSLLIKRPVGTLIVLLS